MPIERSMTSWEAYNTFHTERIEREARNREDQRKTPVAYEIRDIGIEHSQYFGGHGVSGSEYVESGVGIGDNPKEAMEDCLEYLSQGNLTSGEIAWLESQPDIQEYLNTEKPSAYDELVEQAEGEGIEIDSPEWDEFNQDCELYYHVALSVRQRRKLRLESKYSFGGRGSIYYKVLQGLNVLPYSLKIARNGRLKPSWYLQVDTLSFPVETDQVESLLAGFEGII